MSHLSMVWFDFGGVLSPPLERIYEAYEVKTGISPRQLKAAIKGVADEMGLPTMAPVEVGVISEPEWGRRLARVLAEQNPGIDLSRAELETFGRQWFDGIKANPVMVRAYRYIQDNGVRVGVLSNNVTEWGPYWKAIIAPVGEVDVLIDSSEVGHRKPDPEIFEIAAKTADVSPAECLLIDDVEENLAAARAQGWKTVLYQNDEQTLADLHAATGLAGLTDLL
ncbi:MULTISPECIES: HAD family hydrolase [unclassified Kitasatospora]|uniref:HAD family hydrolase n=1 Tax=unclassified Kitasatospora TaxID=2633591 RepID=UPI003710E403